MLAWIRRNKIVANSSKYSFDYLIEYERLFILSKAKINNKTEPYLKHYQCSRPIFKFYKVL